MTKLVKRYGDGGVSDMVRPLIPVVSTIDATREAYHNPTLGNIGMALLSAAGDAGTLFGVGYGLKGVAAGIKATRAASTAAKTAKATRAALATKAANTAATAEKANRSFLSALRMAVPVNLWAENQVYLLSLGLQAKAASKAASTAANNVRKADAAINANPIKIGLNSVSMEPFALGFGAYGAHPLGIKINELSK